MFRFFHVNLITKVSIAKTPNSLFQFFYVSLITKVSIAKTPNISGPVSCESHSPFNVSSTVKRSDLLSCTDFFESCSSLQSIVKNETLHHLKTPIIE